MAARPSAMSLRTPCTETSRLTTVVKARRPAYIQPRLTRGFDRPASLHQGGSTLTSDVDDNVDQGPRRLLRSREVADVARSQAAFLAAGDSAHRQHGSFGVAGEQISIARAVVGEQPVTVGVGALDGGSRSGAVRHDDLAGHLVDPPERRHVLRRPMEDPALTDPRLRRPTGLPPDEAVGAAAQQSVDGRCIARPQRSPEHRLGETVDLDEHNARDVRRLGLFGATSGGVGHAPVDPRRRRRVPAPPTPQ